MKLISRNQLQAGIDRLAKISLHCIKTNPEIAYTTLRTQVEKDPLFFLQQQEALEKIKLEKANLGIKLKAAFQPELDELLKIHLGMTPINKLNCQMKVIIIGAGPAGLLTAYLLARQGAEVIIHEARSHADFSLRPQNISFKEAEIHLKGLLEKKLYQSLFRRGATFDHERKLRITTGTFQEVMLEGIKNFNVKVQYNSAVTLNNNELFEESDCILIAAGAHAYNRLALEEYFEQEVFEQYTTRGKTALFIRASVAPSGFTGSQGEGYYWWRKNRTVFSGFILRQDIDRVIAILSKERADEYKIRQLRQLKAEPKVEYTFVFGNNSPDFLKTLDMDFEPLIQSEYVVTPTILCNPLSEYQNKPLIVMGDGNGTPHPLAAIGTLKFTQDAKELLKFLAAYRQLKQVQESGVFSENRIQDLLKDLKNGYALTAMENIKKVFYANILSALFSERKQISLKQDNFTLS